MSERKGMRKIGSPVEPPCFEARPSEACAPQDTEFFTQESLDSPDAGRIIRLRFTLPREDRPEAPTQRVTECYEIESLFRWVFEQVTEGRDPITTPKARLPLSEAQIARIRRCYFSLPDNERTWSDMNAFTAEMQQRAEEREAEQLRNLAAEYGYGYDSEGDDLSGSDSDAGEINNDVVRMTYGEGITWLLNQYPEILGEEIPELAPDVYLYMMRWLQGQGLLRLDRYTLTEILDEYRNEIRTYLATQFVDLEDMEDVPSSVPEHSNIYLALYGI